MRHRTFVLQLILLACATHASAQIAAQTEPALANPGRPTVSTPATLTPIGYLQLETGVLRGTESPEFDVRVALGEVLKLTVVPRLQLLLATEPHIYSTNATTKENHLGEIFAGAQGVIVPGRGTRPTVSLSYFRRLHASPAPELDIGTFRQNGTLLVSGDVRGFHFDANGIVSEQIEGGVHRAQLGQTLSISHPIKRFTISGEIWHFSQPFLNSNAVGNLWAVAYTVRNNLVVDAGFNRGLTETSTQWEGFIGFTYLIPHQLWKRR